MGSCDRAPSGLDPHEPTPALMQSPPPVVDARAALGAAIEDALVRLLPSLEGADAGPELQALRGPLQALSAALDHPNGNPAVELRAADKALSALETVAEAGGLSVPDVAAIRLVIDRATTLLQP